jgi:hypothetical protein
MALAMVGLDLRIHFRSDRNISFPVSLLFYPVMAYIVVVPLRVIPLTILQAGDPLPVT